ncbi:hypothetical protein [Gallaecimonas mangrovi]|uniref:hypothetical protein n=1 Tax=Gallaecimonas mangrovi TaxID=2291597 RepID=UPI000E20163A|nr:hypothetical protein [Gallaecimonas mangrovi]
MKSWNELTNFQRAIIGISLVIGAAILPEIAFLLNLGGMEVAFALIFASLTPFIASASGKLASIKNAGILAYAAYQRSVSAKPSVFALQASFCAIAFVLTGSGIMAITFFMPGMVLNGILA